MKYTTSIDNAYQLRDNSFMKEQRRVVTRKQLGDILRAAREARGLMSREAAKKLGIDPAYYSRIESGQYALGKHAAAIAKLYKLNVAEVEAMAAQKLPKYRPYLRATTNLPDEALAELEDHFKAVTAKYKRDRR